MSSDVIVIEITSYSITSPIVTGIIMISLRSTTSNQRKKAVEPHISMKFFIYEIFLFQK